MATALEEAEALYEAEDTEQALQRATQAAELLRSSGDQVRSARALRLKAMALIGLERPAEAGDFAASQLSVSRAAHDPWGEAMMLLSMASAKMDRPGEKMRAEAAECAKQARAHFAQLGAKQWEVEALLVLCFCLSSARRGADGGREAIALASQAREIALDLGDCRLEGQSLHCMAAGHAAAGDLEACLRAADEALDLYLEVKDKRLEAAELISMSRWRLQIGEHDRAISDAEDALDIFQLVRSRKEVQALNLLFAAHLAKGDRRRALRAAREALKRFKERKDRRGQGFALDLLLSGYSEVGQLEDALEAGERALSLFQDLDDRKMEAKLSSSLAGLHLRMARFDRALQFAEDAAMLVREASGTTSDKTEAMFHVCEAHLQRKDPASALQAADEMRAHFQKGGDAPGEAAAYLTMAQISLSMERCDEAISAAAKAQVISGESGEQIGEASALRLSAEAHSRKEEHKAALRAAERSRAIFRELGETEEEASSLYLVAQEAISLAVAEGACVGGAGGAGGSRTATDALNKASKASELTIRMARSLRDPGGLLGSALCVMAQVHMLFSRPEEALAAADEAVVVFRNVGSAISEANALLLAADALRVTRQYKDSGEAAEEALRLFRTLDPPNQKGEEFAQEILGYLDQVRMQQQQQAQMQKALAAQGQQPVLATMTAPQEGPEAVPEQVTSMARQERERGPALDLRGGGIDIAVIKAKVAEIATRITGAEDDEIDGDTPLMEAGLTSNSAIILRDELSQELPGVSLPVTLVFDYPSISAMAELICESSGSKAIKG